MNQVTIHFKSSFNATGSIIFKEEILNEYLNLSKQYKLLHHTRKNDPAGWCIQFIDIAK